MAGGIDWCQEKMQPTRKTQIWSSFKNNLENKEARQVKKKSKRLKQTTHIYKGIGCKKKLRM